MPQHVVRRQWQVNDGKTVCINQWQVIHMHKRENDIDYISTVHKLPLCSMTGKLDHVFANMAKCQLVEQLITNKMNILMYGPIFNHIRTPVWTTPDNGVFWLSNNTISFGFFVQLVTSMVLSLSSAELGDLGDRDGALGWMMPMRRAPLKTDLLKWVIPKKTKMFHIQILIKPSRIMNPQVSSHGNL